MADFRVKHRIDLSFVGEGWSDAYIDVYVPTYGAATELAETKTSAPDEAAGATLDYVKAHFAGGRAPSGGEFVELSASDLVNLPISAFRKLTAVLVNGEDILDPKV